MENEQQIADTDALITSFLQISFIIEWDTESWVSSWGAQKKK